jgi:protein-S-isoprenylcysteine O-methyltransferase Ste14
VQLRCWGSLRMFDERHPGPAFAWAGALTGCLVVDALLGRWILLPFFVAAFYGGMVVIDLMAYPLLELWRRWLRTRGVWAWYIVEVGGLWSGTAVVFALLAPLWLGWGWDVPWPLRAFGGLVFLFSVVMGVWALWRMGWARVLFAAALFPPGAGREENRVPQRLVVEGPYRYVRNPLYDTDVGVMIGTTLLTGKLFVPAVLAAYLIQLGVQVYLEERELKTRFGGSYERYCRLVPRFVPRLKPVDPGEISGCGSRRGADWDRKELDR